MRNLLYSIFSIVMISLLESCSNTVETKELCQNNVFSINGVDTLFVYEYGVKNGQVDSTTKKLKYKQKYDSLGNIIYYNGEYYPDLYNVGLTDFRFGVLGKYIESSGRPLTYKIEYQDTIPKIVYIFNENGDYVARLEHNVTDTIITDSIYDKNGLIGRKEIKFDKKGRIVYEAIYDDEYSKGKITLEKRESTTYTDEGNKTTSISETIERDFAYKFNHKYENSKFVSETWHNEKGQIAKVSNTYFYYEIKYNEASQKEEILEIDKSDNSKCIIQYEYFSNGYILNRTILKDGNRQHHSIKHENYSNNLNKCETKLIDNNICNGYTEWVYTFYPYSPNHKTE